MRVLWVSVELPDRDGGGGQRRQFHQISALRELGHKITVLSPASGRTPRSLRSLVPVMRPLLHLRGRDLPGARRRLHRVIADSRWDAIIVSHHGSAWMLPPDTSARVLVDLHNVTSHWHARAGRLLDAERSFAEEVVALRAAEAVCTCSDIESQRLRENHPDFPGPVFTAPLGVAADEWPPIPFTRQRALIALFGGWRWAPNREGLMWFLTEVWPIVLEAVPDAECEVAGSGIPSPLPERVRAMGRVDDLALFTSEATVVATPVLDGVGAPLKFAEALASGAAVIATPDAASAFPPSPLSPRALHVTADAAGWAEWIIERLRSRKTEPAPAAGRQYALETLSWRRAVAPIDAWLGGAAS